MAATSVSQFATELKMPPEALREMETHAAIISLPATSRVLPATDAVTPATVDSSVP